MLLYGCTLITTIKSNLSGMVAVLKDISAYPKWIYATEKAYLIKKIDETVYYYYLKTKSPWPAKDRDIVIKSTIKQMPSGMIIVNSTNVSGYVSKKEGVIRISYYRVSWKFIPQAKGMVKIIYQLTADPGGIVPDWLMESTISIGPFNSIKKFIKLVKEKKYQSAKFDFIKEKNNE